MRFRYLFLIIFLFFSTIANGQIESVSFGGDLHFGNIKGNSTPVTSLGSSLFIDFFPWFEHDVSFRAAFSYSQMVEKFLPENRAGKYYPFIKTFSLKGFIRQNFSYPLYLEQGVGFIYLNDRTLSDINRWEVGAGFSALVGYDFRKIGAQGFSLALGTDYGLTFSQTTTNYFLVFLQAQYYL